MIHIQVIPRGSRDAYKMLRDKVTHGAQTWAWTNKSKTRLRHSRENTGYIEVASADSVLVAQIHPKDSDAYFLTEKFIGRLVAWFEEELFAINVQFIPDEKKRRQ
jgi:hypothetical protein